MTGTDWRIAGEEVGSCNCAWGCPCQFNALPTSGNCEALVAWQVREGRFGDVSLDGVCYAWLLHFPGAVHEGNGHRQVVVDERATPEQREAILELCSGEHGGLYFEIFAAVCPNAHETLFLPIAFHTDRARRTATVSIPGLAEAQAEPIRNPVTGAEHRARIVLPDGFEYKEAEVGNARTLRTVAAPPLAFHHENTYAQFNAFDWSNA